MNKKILIVEDNSDIAELIIYHLEKEGYFVTWVENGEEALIFLENMPCDLLILDLMLPSISGFEVLSLLKSNFKFKAIPVIIESAKTEDVDIVKCLQIGAEDYLTKPFHPKELLARIKKVIDRIDQSKEKILTFCQGVISIDPSNREVSVQGNLINLTSIEFSILEFLARNSNKVLTRDQMIDFIWADKNQVTTRVIDVHVNYLRKKLNSCSGFVRTIRGVGYIFQPDTK
ncbi:response regulator transcription factor [bacterium]|nr:response regulator transcription factor [bacterium]